MDVERRRKLFFAIAMSVMSLTFALILGELLVRTFVEEASTVHGYSPRWPYTFDPHVGWKHLPHQTIRYSRPEFEIAFSTNGEGFRSSAEFRTGDDDGTRVVAILGDSFVQAIQVEEDRTFVKLLENQLQRDGIDQVQNYGVSDTGVVHYLQMYRHYVRPHRPETVIVCIFAANDIRNSAPSPALNEFLRPQYLYDDEGSIVGVDSFRDEFIDPFTGNALVRFLGRNVALYRLYRTVISRQRLQEGLIEPFPIDAYAYEQPPRHDFEEAWRHALWSLEELVGAVLADGARPVVVLIPSNWTTVDRDWRRLEEMYDGAGKLDRDRVSRTLGELGTALDVEFVDLTEPFAQAYSRGNPPHFRWDRHLTTTGHEITSLALLQRLREAP